MFGLAKWANGEETFTTLSAEDAGKLDVASGGAISDHIDLSGGINPYNPGKLKIHKSAPQLTETREFNQREARRLEELAARKRKIAEATEKAYKALVSIETSDTKITECHAGYIRHNATKTLQSVKAMASTSEHLHALRPEYMSVADRMQLARDKANARIALIKEGFSA